MTEQAQKLPGRQLGNYTLTRVLGTGGFAEVYLGIHKHLETQAAIKVLLAQLNQTDQENFLAEARTVARLRHPHIVHILEFGIEEDTPYLVMNYAAHGTLRSRFSRGLPVVLENVLPYFKQMASALQYAHDQQLIHRDIKPENMLLAEQDTVFLSDFGIATQARSSRSQTVEEIIGTVAYMAPEQLQGKPRPASDQYALGIVLYEWLCGVRPFQGSNYIAIATQHLNTPPTALRAYAPALQPAVEQVVLTALTKDYHQRYARVQDFADALEQAHLTGRYLRPQDFASRSAPSQQTPAPAFPTPQALEPTIAPGLPPTQYVPTATRYSVSAPFENPLNPPQKPALSRRTLIGGGVATALLAGGGISWWVAAHASTGAATTPTKQASAKGLFLPQARLIHTYKHTTDIASICWSRDGQYVASVENDQLVHVWRATTGEDLWSARATTPVSHLAWSPDGTRLAVYSNVVQIYQTATHTLSATSPKILGNALAWSPDSRFLVLANIDENTGLATWDGTASHPVTPLFSSLDMVTAIAWKPDGQYIATSDTTVSGSRGYVTIWKIGSSPDSAPQLFDSGKPGFVGSVSWSTSSESYLASANTESADIWDAETLGKKHHQSFLQFCTPLTWSPDGHHLASATTTDNTLQVWNGATGDPASTGKGHTDSITALAWSPDGNYLASTGKDLSVRVWQVRE